MKRLPFIISLIIAAFGCFAQNYNYQPWTPSMGPLTFNTLGDAQHPYVQCKTSSNWQNPTNIVFPSDTAVLNPANTATTHAIITSNGDDPCRCYQLNGAFPHEKYLPPSWDGSGIYQDTVIRIGCGKTNNTCNKAAQIEYWFYPQREESTLLVMFSFALINACGSWCSHGVITTSNGGCASITNPQFFIEVFDGETGQLLDMGYYPDKPTIQNPNPGINTNWPYSRFLAWPSGCNEPSDVVTSPDVYGISTYYWAGQTNSNGSADANGYATPTTFLYRECPSNYTGGNSDIYPVKWFEYKPLAFNLRSVAAQNLDANGDFVPTKSVKLRIRTVGCSATAHWAYGLFTAKMVPGEMRMESCGDQPVVHLSVPWGFLEQTYEWHYGYDSMDAINKIWDLDDPPAGIVAEGPYDVYITHQDILYPYYRCEMKSYTGVPFVYEAHIRNYYIEPEFSYEQDMSSDNITVEFHDESLCYCKIPPTSPGSLPEYTYFTPHIRWFVKNGDDYQLFAFNNTDPVHSFDPEVIDEDGNITVKIIVNAYANGVYCADSIEKVIPLSLVGVPEYSQITFKVYPNPANDMLNVQCTMSNEQIKDGTIQLVDEHEKVVRAVETVRAPSLQRIDISDLAAGVYFVKWVSDGKVLAVRKVVKQ